MGASDSRYEPIPFARTSRKRRRPRVIYLTAAVLIAAAVWLLYQLHAASAQIEIRKRRILYGTNYQALAAACAEVWKKQSTYRRNPDWNNQSPNDHSNPDPADPKMPAVIRRLGVTTITVGPASVRLEMGGGFDHYGVEDFLNGASGSGTRRLAPGLWFYAEDGKVPPP